MADITLQPYQGKVMTCDKRFLAAIAGIQGGKTTLGCAWMLREVAQYPQDDHAIIAPTYKILQQSTLKKFLDYYPRSWGEFHKQDYVFKLRSGGHIYVRSTEDPDALEGMTLRSGWLDEAGQMRKIVWEKMQERTAVKQGRLLMTTTPYAMNWLYELSEHHGDELAIFQWASVQNKFFPVEEFERAKGTLRPEIFDMRYGGQFRKLTGLVYPDFSESCIVPQHPIPDTYEWRVGMDFGYTNPFAAIFIAKAPDFTYIIADELYQRNLLLGDAAHQIKKLSQDRWIKVHFGDPSAKQEIVELQQYGVYVTPAENDVEVGINKVQSFLKMGRLKVMSHCVNTIDEFHKYHYKESVDPEKMREEPEKVYDHAMDAVRYALVQERVEPIIREPLKRFPRYSMHWWKAYTNHVRRIGKGRSFVPVYP